MNAERQWVQRLHSETNNDTRARSQGRGKGGNIHPPTPRVHGPLEIIAYVHMAIRHVADGVNGRLYTTEGTDVTVHNLFTFHLCCIVFAVGAGEVPS